MKQNEGRTRKVSLDQNFQKKRMKSLNTNGLANNLPNIYFECESV